MSRSAFTRVPALLCLLAASSALSAVACGDSSGSDPGETAGAELNETKALGMTDVTILYPLPQDRSYFDDMLGPSSELEQGELLPSAIFAQLTPLESPPMVDRSGQAVQSNRLLFADWLNEFSLMRVVGIRLDPCFGETKDLDSTSCMNTIRLTAQFFQPAHPSPDGKAAIHLFYKISREQFTTLARGMLQLRQATGLPLQKGFNVFETMGVHPTLAAEGLRGPYATGLKNLILRFVGEKTLTRIAFSVQDRGDPSAGNYYNANRIADSRWVFGGFEYAHGQLQPLPISTLDYTGLQTVDSTVRNAGIDTMFVSPPIKMPDNILPRFNPKRTDTPEQRAAADEAARVASINLQNPGKYTTKNADCVSCHMAKQANPDHPADPLDFTSYTFRTEHTTDNVGPFRLFGYDGRQPVVSARVVNETIVVLDYLNRVVMR